jgi:hypothetical protein
VVFVTTTLYTCSQGSDNVSFFKSWSSLTVDWPLPDQAVAVGSFVSGREGVLGKRRIKNALLPVVGWTFLGRGKCGGSVPRGAVPPYTTGGFMKAFGPVRYNRIYNIIDRFPYVSDFSPARIAHLQRHTHLSPPITCRHTLVSVLRIVCVQYIHRHLEIGSPAP